MAKEFFKSYLASKTALEQSNTTGTLNFKCLEVFEKYLFSYKWCRNETERQIFENALVGIAPNKMIIQVERNGGVETLKPESIRSASSRLSKRFYKYFGNDFNEVLICDASLPENRKKLNSLIAKCISMNDAFIFQNHYSSVFQNMIETVSQGQEKIEVPDTLKFSKETLDVLTFFKVHDNSSTLSQLKRLDTECVALIYKVLTTPEYFMQRAEVLEYFEKQKVSGAVGVQTEAYEKRIEDLSLELKAKDIEIRNLKKQQAEQDSKQEVIEGLELGSKRLSEENMQLTKQLADLKADLQKLSSEHSTLESEYQRLKLVAKDDHTKAKKEIEDLKQQIHGLLSL